MDINRKLCAVVLMSGFGFRQLESAMAISVGKNEMGASLLLFKMSSLLL